jgi:hypothetical protein
MVSKNPASAFLKSLYLYELKKFLKFPSALFIALIKNYWCAFKSYG